MKLILLGSFGRVITRRTHNMFLSADVADVTTGSSCVVTRSRTTWRWNCNIYSAVVQYGGETTLLGRGR